MRGGPPLFVAAPATMQPGCIMPVVARDGERPIYAREQADCAKKRVIQFLQKFTAIKPARPLPASRHCCRKSAATESAAIADQLEDGMATPDYRIGVERNADVSAERWLSSSRPTYRAWTPINKLCAEAERDFTGFLGATRPRKRAVAEAVHPNARRIERAVLQVVRRRHRQCVV